MREGGVWSCQSFLVAALRWQCVDSVLDVAQKKMLCYQVKHEPNALEVLQRHLLKDRVLNQKFNDKLGLLLTKACFYSWVKCVESVTLTFFSKSS